MLQSANCPDVRLSKELNISSPIGPGKSIGAKRVQEYLSVNGVHIVIDGNWGDATQAALDKFCQTAGIPSATTVNQALMDRLAQPLLRAAKSMPVKASLGASIVAFAHQQLAEHPIEIGGPNAGPWVRFYMSGNEGAQWLWCAGFVTYVTAYCAKLHATANPVPRTFSCDVLAERAKQAGRFHKKGTLANIPAGSVFLVRSTTSSNDWVHTGIVISHNGNSITTAEGNTNQSGSSNGFEAVTRIRNAANVDIVRT